MYLLLNVFILVRVSIELFFCFLFFFFFFSWKLLLPFSRSTINYSNHTIRFMLVFNSSKKTNKTGAEQCMAVKRLFHAVAQQTNHAARSCRTQGKSRAAFCSRSKVNLFRLLLAPPPVPQPTESSSSLRRGRGELMSLACGGTPSGD